MKNRKPKPGDVWEFQIPGKRRKRKEIGSIFLRWVDNTRDRGGNQMQVPWISWRRQPKGRYTGIRVATLLKFGKLIRTRLGERRRLNKLWKDKGI